MISHQHACLSLLQCYQLVALLVFREYSPRKMFCVRTVIDLFLDRHRQSKIVFYAGFSPALEVQKSVMFLHFYQGSHLSL